MPIEVIVAHHRVIPGSPAHEKLVKSLEFCAKAADTRSVIAWLGHIGNARATAKLAQSATGYLGSLEK